MDVRIPDLTVKDTLEPTITCADDGNITVGGQVSIGNDGCGPSAAGDIPLTYTLYDNTGGTGNIIATWNETVTFPLIAANSTSTVDITDHDIKVDLCADSTDCQVSLKVEVDESLAVCECNGTNNSRIFDLGVDMPDLVVTDTFNPTITCDTDGNVTVGGQVEIGNVGCGDSAATDVQVTFTLYPGPDGTGTAIQSWDEAIALPAITAGTGTATINIPDHDILVDLCANSTNCEVSLVVEVNTGTPDAVCECVGDNNDHTFNLPMEIPDLMVTDTFNPTITCDTDGNVTVGGQVEIGNVGCGDLRPRMSR